MNKARDHIFISYASEQSALCDWLARRLAAAGYAIWYDRLKLLGGENWPTDIDKAIENRTFRMLALLSHASIVKPNPLGEWLKGRAVGEELGIEDFVIPLNTEGLRPDEIPWNLQTINYIPFTPSWANGLNLLLKKLTTVDAPRMLSDGPRLAVASIVPDSVVRQNPEVLMSNCFEIVQMPKHIRQYDFEPELTKDECRALQIEWACRDLSSSTVLAFNDPPSSVSERHSFKYMGQESWRDNDNVYGFDSRDLVVSLIHKSLHHLLSDKGMKYRYKNGMWFLPHGLLRRNRVPVTIHDRKKSWFKGIGERTYPTIDGGEVYRYHLSPSFSVLHDQADPYVLFLRNHVYLTDRKGVPLDDLKARSRRKHLCKNWFNKEWCARSLGIAQLLADEDMLIRFGTEGDQQLIISAKPIVLNASHRIEDELVDEPDLAFTMFNDDEIN